MTRLVWRRWAGRHPTGIDRVCLAYLEHFGAQSQAVVQHRRFRRILDKQASDDLLELLLRPSASFRRQFAAMMVRCSLGPRLSGKGRKYLNVGHTGLDDDGFGAWVSRADVRPIYFLHDLIPITHPEYCRAGEHERHAKRVRTILSTAAGVIGNSQHTIDTIADFACRNSLPLPPTVVAWLGVTALRPSQSAPPSRPTFVILGTIEGRKNHLMLLQAWTRIVEELGERAPRLLVIGQRGWECEQVVDLLERSEMLNGSVVELGRCNDEELAGHLSGARALLFPSLVEGYGLPLVEAMAMGTPAIASDVPAFREVGQGIPDFVDPLDGPAWIEAVLDYSKTGSVARDEQLKKLRAYDPPSWEDHFAKVDRWLSEL